MEKIQSLVVTQMNQVTYFYCKKGFKTKVSSVLTTTLNKIAFDKTVNNKKY